MAGHSLKKVIIYLFSPLDSIFVYYLPPSLKGSTLTPTPLIAAVCWMVPWQYEKEKARCSPGSLNNAILSFFFRGTLTTGQNPS